MARPPRTELRGSPFQAGPDDGRHLSWLIRYMSRPRFGTSALRRSVLTVRPEGRDPAGLPYSEVDHAQPTHIGHPSLGHPVGRDRRWYAICAGQADALP